MNFIQPWLYLLFPTLYHLLNTLGYYVLFLWIQRKAPQKASYMLFIFLNLFSFCLFISLYGLSFILPPLATLFPGWYENGIFSYWYMVKGTFWLILFSFLPHLFIIKLKSSLSFSHIARTIFISNLISYLIATLLVRLL